MKRWKPESKNEDDLCPTARLGRRPADDRYCVHLKGHEGRHHYEGDEIYPDDDVPRIPTTGGAP